MNNTQKWFLLGIGYIVIASFFMTSASVPLWKGLLAQVMTYAAWCMWNYETEEELYERFVYSYIHSNNRGKI